MLYDPKWEQQTKVDPFSLESLIAWLEKKPANKQYPFCKWDECLLAQWLRATVDPTSEVAFGGGRSGFFYKALGQVVDLTAFKHIASGANYHKDCTFGAALNRARKLQRM